MFDSLEDLSHNILMGRTPAKKNKPADRRKHPRSAKGSSRAEKSLKSENKNPSTSAFRSPQLRVEQDKCTFCQKGLKTEERVLFVEEDLGQVFCSESCITSFFAPEIEKLEREYFRVLSPDDLTGSDREKLAHLRWITLEQPDEVWMEKTLSGLSRFTLISQFQPGQSRVWCVCICLFLRGEPSFLYLAFPTKNSAMVDHYRKGEQVVFKVPAEASGESNKRKKGAIRKNFQSQMLEDAEEASADYEEDAQDLEAPFNESNLDRLAESWSEDETVLSENQRNRRSDDIRPEEYAQYKEYMKKTLENPEELWSCDSKVEKTDQNEALRIFHFIRQFKEVSPPFWYVIIAREIPEEVQTPAPDADPAQTLGEQVEEDSQQLEILEAFPTRDAEIVSQYRQGSNELATEEDSGSAPAASSRTVH